MKAAVVTFPGSNCDRDLAVALAAAGAEVTRVWHKDDALPRGIDLVAVPGGFSFGDYLRCGAIAARSPIAGAIRAHAERGGHVLGICNGFQVLTELGLLPGALMRNAGLTFICKDAPLRVDSRNNPFLAAFAEGEEIRLPVAHHDGNYQIDAAPGTRAGQDRAALSRRAERLGRWHCRGPVGQPPRAGDDAASRTRSRAGAWRHRRRPLLPRAGRRGGGGLTEKSCPACRLPDCNPRVRD